MRGALTLLVVLLSVAGFLLLRGHEGPAPDTVEDLARSATQEGTSPDLRAETESGGAPQGDDSRAGRPSGTGAARPSILGVVVDERDRPLPGATVRLETLAPQVFRGAADAAGVILARTTAVTDGRFELPLVEHRWVRVVASLAGHATVGTRVAGAGSSVRLVLPPAASFQVEVVDRHDQPVVGARVEAVARQAVHVEASDAKGRARFDALPPGQASFLVRASGGRRARTGPIAVLAGPVRKVTVLLSDAVSVRGIVLDTETGLPVVGAEVHAAQPGGAFAAEPTGTDGVFGPVEAGSSGSRIALAVRAPGYAPRMLQVVLPRSTEPHRLPPILLTPAAAWQGRVVDAGGRAVPDARVAYTAAGIAGRTPPETRTDEEGRFTLPPPSPPAPGRRVVLTARSGRGSAAHALRPGDVAPADLVLVLTAGHAVSGRVVSATGDPVASVSIRLEPRWSEMADRSRPGPETARLLALGETARITLTTVTDSDGWWRIAGVPNGRYDARLLHDGTTDFLDRPIEIAGADADAGVARLGDGHDLVGTATDEAGNPLAGVEVGIRELGDRPQLRRTVTATDGSWHLSGLPAGEWALSASRTDRSGVRLDLEVPAPEPVDLVLTSATRVTGRVLDARGKPYAGVFRVRVEGAGGGDLGPGGVFRDAGGRFVLEGVPSGTWMVRADTPRGDLGVLPVPIDLRPGADFEVTIELGPGAVLAGTLRRADGSPVSGGRVVLHHEERNTTQTLSTNTDGTYRLAGADAGPWRIVAHGRGGAAVVENVDIGHGEQRTLDLVLGPVTRLTVTVRGEDGGVRPGSYVFVRPIGAPASRPEVVPRTDRAGSVVLVDVPVGRVVLEARTRDGEAGRTEVIAGDDADGAAEIRVRKRARPEQD